MNRPGPSQGFPACRRLPDSRRRSHAQPACQAAHACGCRVVVRAGTGRLRHELVGDLLARSRFLDADR